MNCDVVRDLMPLVIDECCSKATMEAVRSHIVGCDKCRKEFEQMQVADLCITSPAPTEKKLGKLDEWRASLMQSLALVVSFALITLGVAKEAASPEGALNGAWLFALIIPATAFLLSLANLYFIRLYKSRRAFRIGSLLIAAFIAISAFIWGVIHYGVISAVKCGLLSQQVTIGVIIGAVLSVAACAAASLLADYYAKKLGKD